MLRMHVFTLFKYSAPPPKKNLYSNIFVTRFLQSNIHREFTDWPAKIWAEDFELCHGGYVRAFICHVEALLHNIIQTHSSVLEELTIFYRIFLTLCLTSIQHKDMTCSRFVVSISQMILSRLIWDFFEAIFGVG